MAIGHIIGKIQRKGNLEPGLPFLLKKFNRPLFPNRVKLLYLKNNDPCQIPTVRIFSNRIVKKNNLKMKYLSL